MPNDLQPRAPRHPAAMLVALLVVGSTCPAATASWIEEGPAQPTIRALHPLVDRLLEDGRKRSKTLTSVIDHLATHPNVVVQVDVRLESTSAPRGSLQFVASSGDFRFLRILLDTGSTSWPTDFRDLIVMLAHELWHATEAASHDVRNVDAFRRVFQSLGRATGRNVFETEGARLVSEAVRLELSGFSGGEVVRGLLR